MTDPRCKGTYVKVKKPTKKDLKKQLASALSKPSYVGAYEEEAVFTPSGRVLSLAERVRNELERERLQESVPNVNPKNISMRGIEIKRPYVAPVKAAAAAAAAEKPKPKKKVAAAAAAAEKPEKKKKGALAATVAALEEEAFGSRCLNKALLIREAKDKLGLYPPHPEWEEPDYTSEELKVKQLFRDYEKMKERIREMPHPDGFTEMRVREKNNYLRERYAPLVQIEKRLYEGYGIIPKRDFIDDTIDFHRTKNRNISLRRDLLNFNYKHNLPTLRKKYEKYVKEVKEYGNSPHNTKLLKDIKSTLDVIERENIPDDKAVFGYFLEKYGNFFGEDNEFFSTTCKRK